METEISVQCAYIDKTDTNNDLKDYQDLPKSDLVHAVLVLTEANCGISFNVEWYIKPAAWSLPCMICLPLAHHLEQHCRTCRISFSHNHEHSDRDYYANNVFAGSSTRHWSW